MKPMKRNKEYLRYPNSYYAQKDVQAALKEKFDKKYPDCVGLPFDDPRIPVEIIQTALDMREQELRALRAVQRKKILIATLLGLMLIGLIAARGLLLENVRKSIRKNEVDGAVMLGASVHYLPKNGSFTVAHINYDTSEVLLNTHGFLTETKSELTSDQLKLIIINGSGGLGYKPLDPKTVNGLTESEQKKVNSEFKTYLATRKSAYLAKLNNYMKQSDIQTRLKWVFGDKYPNLSTMRINDKPKDLPPEEVTKAVITLYETRPQSGAICNWSWKAVSSEVSDSFAIRSDGTLWAWGLDAFGKPGDGTNIFHSNLVRIGTASNWESISSGLGYSLAVRSDGTLWAWGANTYGELGDGTTANRNVPVRIGTDSNWKAACAGWWTSYAIRSDGTLWAWGNNNHGEIGDGTTAVRHSPVRIGTASNWKMVSADLGNAYAIRSDGTLWAWGDNSFGALGDGTTVDRSSPVRVGSASNWETVSGSTAIRSDGTLWAWGPNPNGELGDGTTIDRYSPVRIGSANNWKTVTAGSGYCLAIRSDGTLWAWGNNIYGNIGWDDCDP